VPPLSLELGSRTWPVVATTAFRMAAHHVVGHPLAVARIGRAEEPSDSASPSTSSNGNTRRSPLGGPGTGGQEDRSRPRILSPFSGTESGARSSASGDWASIFFRAYTAFTAASGPHHGDLRGGKRERAIGSESRVHHIRVSPGAVGLSTDPRRILGHVASVDGGWIHLGPPMTE